MKIPVVYELNDRRRCLLVQDGETISVGRGETCSIRLEGEDCQEVELTAQFVNGCQFVVVHTANGSVPYARPLPWRFTLGGLEVELLRPFRPERGKAERELILQGLSAGEIRLVLPPDQPLLLGSSQACEVMIPEAGCPEVLLAVWSAAGGKVMVQVLDDSAVVGWLGRTGEPEAELELPVSLSIGGRVLVIRSGEAGPVQPPLARPTAPAAALPKGPAILAKNADAGLKIVARQKPDQPVRSAMEAPPTLGSPKPLARPMTVAALEDFPLLAEEARNASEPYRPTIFLLFSWLLLILTFGVALATQGRLLTPEQAMQLWYAAGGTLILTLVLGLGVLLK